MGFCGDQWERFWEGVESGSFRSYARGMAVLLLVLMVVVPFLLLMGANVLPILTFLTSVILGVIMGVIELPYCCACCDWCEKLKAVLEVFENFVLRGFIYVAFGTTLIAISHREDHHFFGWAFGLALPVNGILYWIASCQGETEVDGASAKKEQGDAETGNANAAPPAPQQNTMAQDAEAGAGPSALETAATNAVKEAAKDPAVQKAVVDGVKENPGIALAAARAAARV